MGNKTIEKIYGWVELSDNAKKWIKQRIMKGNLRLAEGWKVVPAHHRPNPTIQIIQVGYPDCEESHLYWFLNNQKRDRNGQVIDEPLPIKSQRDKEFFHEENAKMHARHGFKFYNILSSRRNYIEQYDVDYPDFVRGGNKAPGVRQPVFDDVTEGFNVRPIATGIDIPVNQSVIQPPQPERKKGGRPKGSKNKTKTVEQLAATA